jgi:hypothetical protein
MLIFTLIVMGIALKFYRRTLDWACEQVLEGHRPVEPM